MTREDPTKVEGHRLEGDSHTDIWRKVIPGRRNGRCKGPGAERVWVLEQGSPLAVR